jgi:hypothetical protein
MLNKVLIIVLLVSIYGLLVLFRFDAPPTLDVLIGAIEGESAYTVGDEPNRGETITTKDEWLLLTIGDVVLGLDRNTVVEIEDLSVVGAIVRLWKGRVNVISGETPIWITTNQSESIIVGGSATIINYDFLETVHVVPLIGTVQLTIKSTGEYLLLPVPIAIKEGDVASYETIEVNVKAGEAAGFYAWQQGLEEDQGF